MRLLTKEQAASLRLDGWTCDESANDRLAVFHPSDETKDADGEGYYVSESKGTEFTLYKRERHRGHMPESFYARIVVKEIAQAIPDRVMP
jgi:hypothetical protein